MEPKAMVSLFLGTFLLVFLAQWYTSDPKTPKYLYLKSRGLTKKETKEEVDPGKGICNTIPLPTVVDNHVLSHSQHKTTKRVLVTGAAGFIGSHIADYVLNKLKFETVALDDLSGGFMRNLEDFSRNGGVIEIGDLKNVTFVEEVFQKHGPFDYIYHIAAYAAEGLSHFIRHYNYENNLIGGINLINEAVKQKPIVKAFVFTSSIAAFGTSDGKPPFTETSPKRPEDPYGIAKMAFEQDLQAAYHMFGLHYIIFRPHNVYGPRQNIADKFRNAIGIFMNQILRNENITVFGDGEQTRAFSYISDVSTIIGSSVLYYPAAYNNDFFVGSDSKYSVNSLAVEVMKAMNRTTFVTHLDSRKEVVDAFPVHDKLRCIFNPPAPVTLEEGLRITAQYVVKHGPFEPSGYTNIEVTDHLPPSWSQWLMKKTGDQTSSKHRII